MIELPRITSSIGSSGTESRDNCSAEGTPDSGEDVEGVLLDIEDNFGESSLL